MAHPVHQGRDLPDHMSPTGDAVAVEITIRVYASGAMSVHGPMEDKAWMLAALENAKDAVKNHHDVKAIVIPGKDLSL
jgi:hypothetical protein